MSIPAETLGEIISGTGENMDRRKIYTITQRVMSGPRDIIRQQSGFGLAEALVALAIMMTAVVLFLTSLSTSSKGVGVISERTTAEQIARSQLEYTKSQSYLPAPSSYSVIPSLPSGFTLSARSSSITSRDSNLQKITVTVYRDGKQVLTVEDFKSNR